MAVASLQREGGGGRGWKGGRGQAGDSAAAGRGGAERPPPQADPSPPEAAAAAGSRPGVWTAPRREEERPESARTKRPPSGQRREGCAQLRGEPAAGSRPLPRPHGSRPPTSPRRAAPARAHPLRRARAVTLTKPPLAGPTPGPLPAAASPRILPDKKSYRSPARRGSLGRTHRSGSRSSSSRISTCLARGDSDGGCSAFS